jgi:hypothetical protein
MDSEKKIEAKLVAEVKKHHGWAIKLLATYQKGLPDRIVLMPGGKIYFVELKSEGRVPSKMQVWVHNKLWMLGFGVWVIDSFLLLDNFLNEIQSENLPIKG